MEHFSIVRALSRIAVSDGNESAKQQVERLVKALKRQGDPDATALESMLARAGDVKRLAPSRLAPSAVASPTRRERLSRNVALPVDKETSAPLASIVFPEDNVAQLPVFPVEIERAISTLLLEWEHRDQLREAGLSPSPTCLIYGPPGTGKTSFALWLAKRMGLPAVIAQLDGLISSYLGTTARNVGSLFAFADRFDCVLILDEFDALAKLRDDPNEVGEIKRVVNALLQNLDSRVEAGITIGLTNHDSLLDPAVWRRFDTQFAVPFPGLEQRIAIAHGAIGADVPESSAQAKYLGWLTEGLSGAEITAICRKILKSRVLNASQNETPRARILLDAMLTTRNLGSDKIAVASGEDVAFLRAITADSDLGFSHAQMAYLIGASPKTVGRKLNL